MRDEPVDDSAAMDGSLNEPRFVEAKRERGVFRTAFFVSVALVGLTACSSSPSRNILGSYFPSWMICALAGSCATIAVRVLLVKLSIDQELPVPIVVYLAFTIAFTFAFWLVWLA
jgi:hypothetical protein